MHLYHRSVYCILLVPIFLIMATGAPAENVDKTMVRDIIESVTTLCSLPSEKGQLLEYGGSGEAGVIFRLVGVKGEGHITKKEWDGLQDVLESDRAKDRISSRECAQNLVPVFMKAYGASDGEQAVARREAKIQNDLASANSAMRALAFRDAFRAVSVFTVDLKYLGNDVANGKFFEAYWAGNISSQIHYYSFETGKFSEDPGGLSQKGLNGQLSGDTITFLKDYCSGTLQNKGGGSAFVGPVRCQGKQFTGTFVLR